jgi:hypothetical protein
MQEHQHVPGLQPVSPELFGGTAASVSRASAIPLDPHQVERLPPSSDRPPFARSKRRPSRVCPETLVADASLPHSTMASG